MVPVHSVFMHEQQGQQSSNYSSTYFCRDTSF